MVENFDESLSVAVGVCLFEAREDDESDLEFYRKEKKYLNLKN